MGIIKSLMNFVNTIIEYKPYTAESEMKNQFYDNVYDIFNFPARLNGENIETFGPFVSFGIFDNQIKMFFIKNTEIDQNLFMIDSPQNVFDILEKKIPKDNQTSYCYYVHGLPEGQLAAVKIFEKDKDYISQVNLSNENIAMLKLIGKTIHTPITKFPFVSIHMNGENPIPSSIAINFFGDTKCTEKEIKDLLNAIIERYSLARNPNIVFEHKINPHESTLNVDIKVRNPMTGIFT